MYISKMQKKIQKKFFVFEVIAPQLVPLNFLYKERDTSHRQPMF